MQRLGSMLGAGFSDGGVHPRFGTRNFVLPLAGGVYLEVVGVLDHPAVDKAPFGRAVKRRCEEGGGWLGWVLAVDDIEAIERRLGRDAVVGNRYRPDGVELHWLQLGVLATEADPQLPYFIHWADSPELHPSSGASPLMRLDRIEICGNPAKLADWLHAPPDVPAGDVELQWVDAEEPGIVAIHVITPRGRVRID